MVDERRRFQLLVGIAAAIIVVGVLFVAGILVDEDSGSWAAVLSAVILVCIALAAIFVARKRLREMREGIPSEDERSTAIKMRAGYMSFFVSMYLCLGLGWLFGVILEDTTMELPSTGVVMFVLVAAMGSIYLVTWTVMSRGKGIP